MDTNTNTAATPAATPAAKVPTIPEDFSGRRTFYPTEDKTALEQAQEYLAASMERFADFGDYPFAAPGVGVDEDGDTVFDSEAVYTDDSGVMIGTLATTTGEGKDRKRGVKCLFMVPIPDFSAMAATATEDESLRKWMVGILEKEANHVAVRPLRDADDVSDVVDQMPTTLEAYTTSGRAGGAGIMVAFNELYKLINATLSAKIPAWAKARFIKSELKKALESKAYALEYYGALEDRGDNDSLLVVALNLGINAAKKKGFDPSIFERWLATRDSKVLASNADESDEADDFDLDALTEDLLSDGKAAAEPAATGSDDSTAPATDETTDTTAAE